MKADGAGAHPLVSSLPARIQLLCKVPQVVVVVEVTQGNQILKGENMTQILKKNNKSVLGWDKGDKGLFWTLNTSLKSSLNDFKDDVTVQNWMPLTLLPSLSSGGDQHMMPITLGTTSRIPPATPDLAGRPTWGRKRECAMWDYLLKVWLTSFLK